MANFEMLLLAPTRKSKNEIKNGMDLKLLIVLIILPDQMEELCTKNIIFQLFHFSVVRLPMDLILKVLMKFNFSFT